MQSPEADRLVSSTWILYFLALDVLQPAMMLAYRQYVTLSLARYSEKRSRILSDQQDTFLSSLLRPSLLFSNVLFICTAFADFRLPRLIWNITLVLSKKLLTYSLPSSTCHLIWFRQYSSPVFV